MGYLICTKCGGYYELREGEVPDDFASCKCTGKLKFIATLDDINKIFSADKDSDGAKEVSGSETITISEKSMRLSANQRVIIGSVYFYSLVLLLLLQVGL